MAHYVDGELHGRYTTRRVNSIGGVDRYIEYECDYVMGKKHGIENKYYEGGDIATRTSYQNDKKHGWEFHFLHNFDSTRPYCAILYYLDDKVMALEDCWDSKISIPNLLFFVPDCGDNVAEYSTGLVNYCISL
jgi:hypothetical protein